ncbi:unnamed protein product, partial [Brassica rapa]
HGRPVCADGHHIQPRTSCVCWRTPTDTHGHTQTATDPRGPKSPKQSTGRASSKDQRADMCTDG